MGLRIGKLKYADKVVPADMVSMVSAVTAEELLQHSRVIYYSWRKCVCVPYNAIVGYELSFIFEGTMSVGISQIYSSWKLVHALSAATRSGC